MVGSIPIPPFPPCSPLPLFFLPLLPSLSSTSSSPFLPPIYPSPVLPSVISLSFTIPRPINPIRGLGEHCKLPQRGPGRAPAANAFACMVIATGGDDFPSWWSEVYVCKIMTLYGRLQYLTKTWSSPLWDGPYRPQKWSSQAQDPGGNRRLCIYLWWFNKY